MFRPFRPGNSYALFIGSLVFLLCPISTSLFHALEVFISISNVWTPYYLNFKHFILNGLKKSSRTLTNSILQPIIKVPYSHLNPEKLKIKRTNYLNALFNAKYRLLLLILSTIVFVFPFYTLILSFSFISTDGYFCLDIGKRSKSLT